MRKRRQIQPPFLCSVNNVQGQIVLFLRGELDHYSPIVREFVEILVRWASNTAVMVEESSLKKIKDALNAAPVNITCYDSDGNVTKRQ